VVDLGRVVLCHDVLAVGFSQLRVSAYLVDDNSAFGALQDVREEAVGQFFAEIAEIEGLFL